MAKKAASLLKDLAKKQKATTPKKETHPVLPLPSTDENVQLVLEWIRAKRQEKQGEALRKQQEESLLPTLQEMRAEFGKKHAEFHSNVKISVDCKDFKAKLKKKAEENLAKAKTDVEKEQAKAELEAVAKISDQHMLSLVVQNKYSEIPLENEEKLVAMVADVFELSQEDAETKFGEMFPVETKIEVSEAGKRDIDELLPKIIDAIGGQEKFAEYFTVKQYYKPSENCHQSSMTDPKMAKFMEKAGDEKLVRPQKPSIRNQ